MRSSVITPVIWNLDWLTSRPPPGTSRAFKGVSTTKDGAKLHVQLDQISFTKVSNTIRVIKKKDAKKSFGKSTTQGKTGKL